MEEMEKNGEKWSPHSAIFVIVTWGLTTHILLTSNFKYYINYINYILMNPDLHLIIF